MQASDLPSWLLTPLAALLSGGGVWLWLSNRATANAPGSIATGQAQLQKVLGDEAAALIDRLQNQIDQLSRRLADVEAENHRCQGENRQMLQRIDSMESLMRRAGIPVPAGERFDGTVEIADGVATFTPNPPKRPRVRSS